MSDQWWSIEVLDGAFSAARWQDAHGAALIEAALSHGARDWHWQRHRWGVVFEVAFPSHDVWSVYRQLPGVRAALDAVPDPINGLLVYPGRGGSAGAGDRRRPGPHLGAGGAPLPEEPEPIIVTSLVGVAGVSDGPDGATQRAVSRGARS